ncbi:MAG: OPT/YSL family transporter [Thermoplasmata archaeon]
MALPTFRYREPPTSAGLQKIEKGTLNWFDVEMYANLNSGVLEEYLDEKNRRDGFAVSKFVWWKILLGIIIGTIFAVITEYTALKVGMALSGAWYVSYLIGLAFRWKPAELNNMSAGTNAANMICTGFIFVFPALYLLMFDEKYAIGVDEKKNLIFLITSPPPALAVLVPTILAGFLGVLYFLIFRRIWLVEDPLHVPGFEATVSLLEIANSMSEGSVKQALKSLWAVSIWSIVSGVFTFLRDMPLIEYEGEKISILDKISTYLAGGEFYFAGEIKQPESTAKYTFLSFGIIPIQMGIGWFMKFRTALLMCLGTFLTWFVIVPMAVAFNVPIYDIKNNVMLSLMGYNDTYGPFPAWIAFRKIAVPIGIGAILGGGGFAILKMIPTFKKTFVDIGKAFSKDKDGSGGKSEFIKDRGWYEWPLLHIPLIVVVGVIVITAVFVIEGYPLFESVIFSLLLSVTCFVLGAIAVKTMGETGSEPVSATSILVLLFLIVVFKFILRTPTAVAASMSLLGTTIFCGAISMSGDIILDFKTGIYMGNRPYHLTKVVLTALIPGAVVSYIGAAILSEGLAKGQLNLAAPQANMFAQLTQMIFGGGSNEFLLEYIILGIVIGVGAELLTGMGTAFGLGMYFPLSIQLPLLLGGAARDIWEIKYFNPMAKKLNLSERDKTLRLLSTFMIATGLMIGEAVMGSVVAIYLVFS